MNILTRYTSRDYLRNGKLNLVGGNVSYVSGGYGGSIMSGNYLPATPNGDGTYTVDLSQVTFNGHIVASGEVSAYGSGSTSGGSTGSIDIEDNLTSERTDAALSANQGKVLKELIDNIDIPEVDLSNYYTKSQVDTKLDNLDIPEVDLSNYYNKTETDTKLNNKLNQSVWDNVFEVNSDGSLKVKVNLYGDGEISAYGSGTTGNTTLDLDNYYTKDEIDTKLGDIECTGGTAEVDLSNYYTKAQVNTKLGGYSETSHTHTDYVSTVKVGTTDYAVKDNVISIPAYPTLTTLSAASSTDLTNHTANTTAHITATERTNWNNKLNKSVWDDVFEINEDGSLKVKVNLYGDGEISAYGSGSTGGTTEINLENYYTKTEIDDKLDNIECTGGTEVDLTNYYTKAQVNTKLGGYSETSHTHSNYSLTSHTHSNYSTTSHTHSLSALTSTAHTHSTYYDSSVSRTKNTVLAAPNGSAGTASFRALVAADIPSLAISKITNLQTTLDGKSGTGHSHNYTSTVKIGSTSYNVSANTISLPSYPTLSTLSGVSTTNFNSHSGNTTLHITAAERTKWNGVVNDWNDVFEIDSSGNLKVKVNLYGEGEISAYGSGSTGNSSIDLSGYYTKEQVDDLINNIDVGDVNVDLSNYYTKAQVNTKLGGYSETSHTHSNYSLTSHTHSGYASTSHTHTQYASSSHTHPISAITSLQTTLDGKSSTSHTHSNYSLTSHTHSYLPLSGGIITGTLSIQRDSSVIRYYDSTGTLQGWLGFNGVNNPVMFKNDNSTVYRLLHAGNSGHTHSAYYDSTLSRTKNTVLAAPNGSAGTATFRALVAADIPSLAISKITNLQSTLDGKSGTGHSHSNYSVTSHTHSNYSLTSHSHSNYSVTSHTHALSALTSTAHTHTTIVGNYTANGGQQPPNYFGKNRVGALMMSTTVNGNSQYKDWLFMDCYSGNDVGGGVAFGVNRQTLGAYIMRSASGRTSWAESAELLGTHNWSTYCAAKSHTHSTLTFSAGAFSSKTYNGGSAVTVSVPTHTSHITNNSGFITTGATVAAAYSAASATTIISQTPQLAAASESNNINIVNNGHNSITTNSPENLASITKAIRFKWYNTYWEIGNIRGSSTNSMGFGITSNNNNLRFRVATDKVYAYGGLQVNGGVTATGEITAHSDRRLKSDIKLLENRGELQPKTFIKDGKKCIGFIAQDVEELYPELVLTDESTEEKYKSLNYAQLTAVLAAQINELKKEINELKNKIQ